MKTTPEQAQPVPGLAVETFDGRRLGVVASAYLDGLMVHRRLREQFWLPEGLIRDVDDQRVLLHVDSKVVPRYSQTVAGRNAHFRRLLGTPAVWGLGTMVLLMSLLALGFA